MKTLLLYNPRAGRHRTRRMEQVQAAARQLALNGFATTVLPTQSPGSAGRQASEAIASGFAAVFACGGDGTVHEVLQGIAGSNVLFGILPCGSANALAAELGIPRDLVRAAAMYRPDVTTPVRVGVVRRPDTPVRYFLSMAGAGPDGALMYRMLTVDRRRWGRFSYYAHAARLFLTHTFSAMDVSYCKRDGTIQTEAAVAVMTLRIRRLGGIFSGLASQASVHSPEFLLLSVHPPAGLSLPLWFLTSWLRLTRLNPLLTVAHTSKIALQQRGNVATARLQADGEVLGAIPCEIELLQQSVRVFVPV